MAYTYNPNTHYLVGEQPKLSGALMDSYWSNIANALKGKQAKPKPVKDFTGIIPIEKVIVQLDGFTGFDVHFPDDFLQDSEYRIKMQVNESLTADDLDHIAKTYETTDAFNFYQNQHNFAVWCATTGCGVGKIQHLQHPNSFTRSIYRYHF